MTNLLRGGDTPTAEFFVRAGLAAVPRIWLAGNLAGGGVHAWQALPANTLIDLCIVNARIKGGSAGEPGFALDHWLCKGQ